MRKRINIIIDYKKINQEIINVCHISSPKCYFYNHLKTATSPYNIYFISVLLRNIDVYFKTTELQNLEVSILHRDEI